MSAPLIHLRFRRSPKREAYDQVVAFCGVELLRFVHGPCNCIDCVRYTTARGTLLIEWPRPYPRPASCCTWVADWDELPSTTSPAKATCSACSVVSDAWREWCEAPSIWALPQSLISWELKCRRQRAGFAEFVGEVFS